MHGKADREILLVAHCFFDVSYSSRKLTLPAATRCETGSGRARFSKLEIGRTQSEEYVNRDRRPAERVHCAAQRTHHRYDQTDHVTDQQGEHQSALCGGVGDISGQPGDQANKRQSDTDRKSVV